MRVLRLAKESAVKARTQAKNQLKAVLLGVDPALREALSELSNTALINRCADFPDAGDAAVFTLRLLARRIQQLTAEVKEPLGHQQFGEETAIRHLVTGGCFGQLGELGPDGGQPQHAA